MSEFQFQSLHTQLDKNTRSLQIIMTKEAQLINAMDELLSILNWSHSHLEIHAITISTEAKVWPKSETLGALELEALEDYSAKKKQCLLLMLSLPQTVIFDMAHEINGCWLELSLGADIRICHKQAIGCFDFLREGLPPIGVGVSILSHLIHPAQARAFLLASGTIAAPTLVSSGLVYKSYEKARMLLAHLLIEVATQAPIVRVQTKRALLESVREKWEGKNQKEERFLQAALISRDWQKKGNFTAATALASVMRKQASKVPQ